MIQLLTKYKQLKLQLVEEDCSDAVMWNEGILEAINNLFKEVDPQIIRLIKLNLL